MSEQWTHTLEGAIELARDMAATVFGHKLSRFETCGEQGASAECVRPGCNMGLTVRTDEPGWAFTIRGMAAANHCASPERPLRDTLTLMYRADPLEGK